ncbi:antirestriction protein [Xenorhabdus doucetiae]|uniref:antirestriction protein n=1 Tax=Xenorhabdus doucetiae TaxID=351671 RepID=UPI002B40B1E2|nr:MULTISPECIES: antirestriction protein [unclassified Xenorhabdus]
MWYICAPLEADIVKFNYDEGFLIIDGQPAIHSDGEPFPSGRCSPSFFKEFTTMPNDEFIQLDTLSLSATFPGRTPLERLFLGFLLANTASRFCQVYRPEHWESRRVSEGLSFLVPTQRETYPVWLPDQQLHVTLSAEAFGLAVTMAVFVRIAAVDTPNEDAHRFGQLRKHASQHAEAALIKTALDTHVSDEVVSAFFIGSQNNKNH